MIKEDDVSNIKNLDIGISDTLNVIKESENNFQNVPENKEIIQEKSTDVIKMDSELRKDILNDLREDLTNKINKSKSKELKKQLIKLDYEKKLCLATKTKYKKKIIRKIKLKLTLSLSKLAKLQTKLDLVEQFIKNI